MSFGNNNNDKDFFYRRPSRLLEMLRLPNKIYLRQNDNLFNEKHILKRAEYPSSHNKIYGNNNKNSKNSKNNHLLQSKRKDDDDSPEIIQCALPNDEDTFSNMNDHQLKELVEEQQKQQQHQQHQQHQQQQQQIGDFKRKDLLSVNLEEIYQSGFNYQQPASKGRMSQGRRIKNNKYDSFLDSLAPVTTQNLVRLSQNQNSKAGVNQLSPQKLNNNSKMIVLDRAIKTSKNSQKHTQTAILFHKNPVNNNNLTPSGSKSLIKKNAKTTEVIARKKLNLEQSPLHMQSIKLKNKLDKNVPTIPNFYKPYSNLIKPVVEQYQNKNETANLLNNKKKAITNYQQTSSPRKKIQLQSLRRHQESVQDSPTSNKFATPRKSQLKMLSDKKEDQSLEMSTRYQKQMKFKIEQLRQNIKQKLEISGDGRKFPASWERKISSPEVNDYRQTMTSFNHRVNIAGVLNKQVKFRQSQRSGSSQVGRRSGFEGTSYQLFMNNTYRQRTPIMSIQSGRQTAGVVTTSNKFNISHREPKIVKNGVLLVLDRKIQKEANFIPFGSSNLRNSTFTQRSHQQQQLNSNSQQEQYDQHYKCSHRVGQNQYNPSNQRLVGTSIPKIRRNAKNISDNNNTNINRKEIKTAEFGLRSNTIQKQPRIDFYYELDKKFEQPQQQQSLTSVSKSTSVAAVDSPNFEYRQPFKLTSEVLKRQQQQYQQLP